MSEIKCQICEKEKRGESTLCKNCGLREAKINSSDGIYCIQCVYDASDKRMMRAAISLLMDKVDKLEKQLNPAEPERSTCPYGD